MKSWLIFFCVLLLQAGLKAQNKSLAIPVESITEKQDTAYINRLTKAAVDNYLQYPDSSRALAEKALILSKQLQYDHGAGTSYAAIGYTYWAQSYFSLSLYYLFNAVDYLAFAKDYAELSMCERIIAHDYIEAENYPNAEAYLKKANAHAILSKDPFKIGLVYNETSLLDFRQGKYKEAWEKGITALNISFKNKDTILTGIIYSRLGDILKGTGKQALAKNYFDTALTWSLYAKNNRLRAILYTDFAAYHIFKAHTDSALAMSQTAQILADSFGNLEVKAKAVSMKKQAWHAAGDIKKELEYGLILTNLQDSIRKVYRGNNFQLLQQFYALNKRIHDIDEQEHHLVISKERLRYQHTVIIALVVFIAVLMAGLFTIFYLYAEKRKMAKELFEKNSAVTDQKNIIEEQSQHLARLNDLKTKLFAVISHDLRSPISSLRSIMGMFQHNDLTEEQAIALLKRMLPALDGADLTLSNLLNWSVKQMNGLNVNKTTFQVYQIIEEIERVFEFALQQKNIQYTINVSIDTSVHSDEHHVKIILRNLISNAIKFTPENGTITIGGEKQGDNIVLSITDTGNGINEQNMAKLFVTTSHFTTRGTAGEKGTGLGLLLCKELLDLNNGSISVTSAPGAGTTFFIRLPCSE